jgi:hypothetical protein
MGLAGAIHVVLEIVDANHRGDSSKIKLRSVTARL